jgi:ABC-type transport system involved in multi-copper enzyme maturation permease subunit
MRLGAVFRFELRMQVRRPTTWIYAAVFLASAGGIAANYHFQAGNGGSHFDAPVAVAAAIVMATLTGLLLVAALTADAATRDASMRVAPLFYTTPVRRDEYLGGRFLAAFTLYALLLALVPIGLLLMARFAVAPDLLGPFRPRTYLEAYLFIGLPSAFVTTALLFAVAALGQSAVATYVGAVAIFFGTMISFATSTSALAGVELSGLLDPFAFGAIRRLTAGWTVAQRNALPVSLAGELLWNRIVWMLVAFAVLSLTVWRFRMGHPAASRSLIPRLLRARSSRGLDAAAAEGRGAIGAPHHPIPHAARHFGLPTRIRQTLAIARRAFLDVATSRGALVILAFAVFRVLTGPEFLEHMGVPLHATTAATVAMMRDGDPPMILLLAPLLAIFYAGELVWKERDLRLASLTGTAPVGGWAILIGKFLGLALVLVGFQALLVTAGIVVQLVLDAPAIDLGLYAMTFLGLELVGYLVIAAVAIVAQVIAGGKYVGWLAAILAFAIASLAPLLGVEHGLLAWQSGPAWAWSELRGFGATLAPALWVKAYWSTWALLLAFVARLFVVRGIDLPWRERLSRARERFSGGTALGTLGAAGAVCGLGGFVFWNTNVLNDYVPRDARIERFAEYERRYGGFEGIPQPTLRRESLRVELYPSERRAEVAGRWLLINGGGTPMDTIHVATSPGVETGEMRFGRSARAAVVDRELHHRIYVLESPLLPGDSISVDFAVRYAPRGFAVTGVADAVVANGTFVALEEWLPAIGYQRSRELPGERVRKERGLPPRPRRPPEDQAGRRELSGRERVALEIVVGTEAEERAVTSGVLRRSWSENGRAYFEYASAAPVLRSTAILSAEYAVHRSEWRGIPIEVLYDRDHPWNVERFARSIAASLAYFARELGPYPFEVVRAVERPSAGVGATAFPGLVAYSQGMALLHPEADPRGLDFPFAVFAHEMAHMWWGNQFVPAPVDGAGLISESLAWFGAYGVVEEAYGSAQLDALLGIMREAYLAPMPQAGVPLLRGDDWFQAYRRGAFAMYSAREHLGREPVGAALRRLFAAHAEGRPPLPTSLDLYRELQAITPDSLETLIGDLFERNVWWELTTKRAEAESLPSGAWRVTLGLNVRRAEADTLRVNHLPLDEIVQVAVYGEDSSAAPLYFATHRIREREPVITLTVPTRPTRAGIDPNHLLLDDDPWDNHRPVVVQQGR